MNKIDMNNRVAIVTGGAQGFGYAIAKRLLSSGAKVRIWDRDSALLDKSVSALGAGASGDALDVANAAGVERAAAKAISDFGRVDVLVNNAGIAGENHKTIDYPIEEWERVLRVNLTSQFLCCRALGAHMVARRYGRIVNIASIAGKEGNPNAVAYSAAKAGVISTKSLGGNLPRTVSSLPVYTRSGRTAILDQSTRNTSRTWCPRSRPAPGGIRKSRRWFAGSLPRSAPFPPAACSTSPAAGPLIRSTLHGSTLNRSTLHRSTLHRSTLHRSSLHRSTLQDGNISLVIPSAESAVESNNRFLHLRSRNGS
jgi:3-oxoacyl-[acyl-carrier protein] reductase